MAASADAAPFPRLANQSSVKSSVSRLVQVNRASFDGLTADPASSSEAVVFRLIHSSASANQFAASGSEICECLLHREIEKVC